MFDLNRALYSHCEYPGGHVGITDVAAELLNAQIRQVLGASAPNHTRFVTYLQGSVDLLHEENEFRAHIWFDLPEAHPSFSRADRGLICLVQACDNQGVYGPVYGQLSWLGEKVHARMRLPADDWIADMIRAQGYLSIPGAEWIEQLEGAAPRQLMTWLLARHLENMINHKILEERLYSEAG